MEIYRAVYLMPIVSKLNSWEPPSGKGKTVRLKTGIALPDVTSKSSLVKALVVHKYTQNQ